MQTTRNPISIGLILLIATIFCAILSYFIYSQRNHKSPEIGALSQTPIPSIVPNEYDSFIKSVFTGKCVSLADYSRDNDAQLVVGDCWENPRGRIWFDQVADGYTYQLRVQYSGKCLEPEGAFNNAKLVQRVCHRGDYQRPQVSKNIQLWNINAVAGGKFSIEHVDSGYAITAVADISGSSKLHLQVSNQSDAQAFSYHRKVKHNTDPQKMGVWGDLIAWPFVPIQAAALYNDTVLSWSSNEKEFYTRFSSKSTWSSVFDIASETFVSSNNPTHDMFCAGSVQMEDGSVLASGGNPQANEVSRFDPASNTWSLSSPMRQQRWYGTNVLTGRGDVLSVFAKGAQETPELYSPSSNTWRDLPGADMSDMRDEQDMGNALKGNYSSELQWYAFMHTAPDGRIFNSGPLTTMHWYGTDGSGSAEAAGSPPDSSYTRQFGSAVMYDVGKLLVSGGSDPRVTGPNDNGDSGEVLGAIDTAFTVDINAANPVIEAVDSMSYRRANHNSVVLPTGEVFVVGGNKHGMQFKDTGYAWWSEIWSPQSKQWRRVAPTSAPRGYHSWALLMRDGRVLVGGGGLCGTCAANHPDAQFYNPPYLFSDNGQAASRPRILSATSDAQVGSEISVTVDRAVRKFNLIRLSTVTHSINTDQRLIPLAFEQSSTGNYLATLSSNTNVLTPGMYWLFALDDQGVPSQGHVLHIQSLAENTEPLLVNAMSGDTLKLNKNDELNISLLSTGFDASALVASAIDLPVGMHINQQNHTLEGYAQSEGEGSFILSVSDGSKQLTQRINYTVAPVIRNTVNGSGGSGSGSGVSEGSGGPTGGGGVISLWLFLLLVCRLLLQCRGRACAVRPFGLRA